MMQSLHSNGKYAIVDSFYQHIWMLVDDEKIAHYIRKTFQGKVQTWIFDLTTFENYTPTLIDSNNSLGWKISIPDYDTPYAFANLMDNKFDVTQTKKLANVLESTTNKCPLSLERQKDLQDQMILYSVLLKKLIGNYGPIRQVTDIDSQFLIDFNKIFQTEIDTNIIKENVYQLAINSFNTNCLSVFIILSFLGRRYE